jgi:hypothetical protein
MFRVPISYQNSTSVEFVININCNPFSTRHGVYVARGGKQSLVLLDSRSVILFLMPPSKPPVLVICLNDLPCPESRMAPMRCLALIRLVGHQFILLAPAARSCLLSSRLSLLSVAVRVAFVTAWLVAGLRYVLVASWDLYWSPLSAGRRFGSLVGISIGRR